MKGLKEKFRKEHLSNFINTKTRLEVYKGDMMAFTYLDLVPLIFDKENVMEYLADSGWIEGLVIKYLGDQFPYLDDYIQDIYLLIFEKLDHLIDIYEDRGILAFCGYIKMIVFTNCFAKTSLTYKRIRYFSKDFIANCTDETWNDIIDQYDPDKEPFYRMSKTPKTN